MRRLLYFEQFDGPAEAIAREKHIKGWKRSKRKLRAIHSNKSGDGWILVRAGSTRDILIAAFRMTEVMMKFLALSFVRHFLMPVILSGVWRSEGSRPPRSG